MPLPRVGHPRSGSIINTYYNKKGKVLGRAWSTMDCNKVHGNKNTDPPTKPHQPHEPHAYHPMYAMYGPYMCAGFPTVELFDTKPRKPVN